MREGALVLPAWHFQLTPQFSYAHWDKIQDPFISNSYSGALSLAVGLPWTSQVSVSVPYVYDQGRDGNPSSSGLADVGFLFSKELLVDNGTVPNLVGSVGWTSPTSRSSAVGPIPYVSGFQAGFTASKQLDPLVVFLSASYFSAAEVAGLEFNPANVVGGRIGASLAISPATAITTGFNVAYLTDTHSADLVLPNSDRLLSSVDEDSTHSYGTARCSVSPPNSASLATRRIFASLRRCQSAFKWNETTAVGRGTRP